MKKHLQSVWMRALSCVVCAVSIITILLSIVSVLCVKSDTYKSGYQTIASNYGIYAMEMIEAGQGDVLREEFERMGISCNIDLLKEDTEEHLFSCGILKEETQYGLNIVVGSDYNYNIESLLQVLTGTGYHSSGNNWVDFQIERVVFDSAKGLFLYETPMGYFLVKDLRVYIDNVYVDYQLKEEKTESTEYGYYCNGYYDAVSGRIFHR